MFKRTGWFPTAEAHARRCECGKPSAVYGPYGDPDDAAQDAQEEGYVNGEVVFFDWDSPPGVLTIKQELWMGSMEHRAQLLADQFGEAAAYLRTQISNPALGGQKEER